MAWISSDLLIRFQILFGDLNIVVIIFKISHD